MTDSPERGKTPIEPKATLRARSDSWHSWGLSVDVPHVELPPRSPSPEFVAAKNRFATLSGMCFGLALWWWLPASAARTAEWCIVVALGAVLAMLLYVRDIRRAVEGDPCGRVPRGSEEYTRNHAHAIRDALLAGWYRGGGWRSGDGE